MTSYYRRSFLAQNIFLMQKKRKNEKNNLKRTTQKNIWVFTFPNSYFRLTHPPNNKSTLPIHFMYHVSGITQPPTSLINQICPTTISSKHYVPSRFMLMLFSFVSFKRLLHYASLQNLVLCNTQPHNSLQPFYFFYHNNKLSFSFLSIMNQKEA